MLVRFAFLFVALLASGCTHWHKTTSRVERRVVQTTIVSEPYKIVEIDGRPACRAIARVEYAETWLVDYERRGQTADFGLAAGLAATGGALAIAGQERFLSVGSWDLIRGGEASPVLLTGAGIAFVSAAAVLGYAVFSGGDRLRPAPQTVRRVVRQNRAVDTSGCEAAVEAAVPKPMIRNGMLVSALDTVAAAQD